MNVVLRLMEAAVEFVWWSGVVVGFAQSFSCPTLLPNYSVEVVLRCVAVWVVTIYQWMIPTDRDFPSRISIDVSI